MLGHVCITGQVGPLCIICISIRETSKFISTLISKISERHDLQLSSVANYIRTKISFELVRSQIMCIRGSRRRRKIEIEAEEIQVVESISRVPEVWTFTMVMSALNKNEQKRIMDWLVTVLGLYWRRMKEKKDADLYIKFHVERNTSLEFDRI